MSIQKRLMLTLFTLIVTTLLLTACGGSAAPEQAAAPAEVSEPAEPAESDAAAEAVGGMETYVIIPAESRASYLVDEEFFEGALSKLGIEAGKKDVVGSTHAVEGQIDLNLADLTAVLGDNSFSVDLSTLESDQNRRDNWIRDNGPTFNRFPQATFTATSISGLPDSYTAGETLQFQVSGDLTVVNTTVPVTFDATATVEGDILSGVLTTRRLISEFGIDPPDFANTLTVADEFGIQVEFTAKKQ